MATRVYFCISAYQKNALQCIQLACSNRTRTSAHTHVFWALWSELVRCLHFRNICRNIPGNFVGWTGCTNRFIFESCQRCLDSISSFDVGKLKEYEHFDIDDNRNWCPWFLTHLGICHLFQHRALSIQTCSSDSWRTAGTHWNSCLPTNPQGHVMICVPNLVMTYYARSSCSRKDPPGQSPSPKSLKETQST